MNIWLKLLLIFILMKTYKYENVDEFSTCFDRLGCVNFTSEWFDSKLRAKNLEPLDRHIINTRFLFLTKSKERETILYDTISVNPDTINITKYKDSDGVIILIHDFTSNGYTGWIKHIALEMFKLDKYNVIAVDWQEGAEPPFAQAISNARVVALETVALINTLQRDFSLMVGQLHLIGHGVGAHIAGYIGKQIENVGRITALDPTGPLFEGMPPVVKLTSSDAFYVEVLHTDGEGSHRQGTLEPMGNLDFYFNNGSYQPGCEVSKETRPITKLTRADIKEGKIVPDCSHKRAFKYYLEAIKEKNCQFVGFQDDKINDFKKMGCVNIKTGCINCAAVGLDVDLDAFSRLEHTQFYLKTGSHKPFCMNQYHVNINFEKCPEAEAEATGFFDMDMVEENTNTKANITFNKKQSLPILLGNSTSFVIYSTNYGIDSMKDVQLRWHFTSKFCYHCKNATCIKDFSVVHMRSYDGASELPTMNKFCPKYGQYAVLYDNTMCDDFVRCDEKNGV